MYRFVIILSLLVFLSSCGQKEEESDTASSASVPAPPNSRSAIDAGEFSEFEKIINGSLKPYFDVAGTQTELEVAPGDYFDVYIFAEFNEAYDVNAAEWKLVLPDEVSIMSVAQTDSVLVSLGKHEEDFMIAFRCLPGPRDWIVRYQCKAHEGFAGGAIETVAGQNLKFIGFTICDATHTEVKGRGGKAELKRK